MLTPHKTSPPKQAVLASNPSQEEFEEEEELDEIEKLLQEARKLKTVPEQERKRRSIEDYRRAKRYFEIGDFTKAKELCEQALKTDPENRQARELLNTVNLFIGEAPGIEAIRIEKMLEEQRAALQGFLIQQENRYNKAEAAIIQEDYETAEIELKTIIYSCRAYFYPHPKVTQWMEKASLKLDEVKKLKKRKQKELERKKRMLIEEEMKLIERLRREEERRSLEMMFQQALDFFEKEQYDKCIDLCDRMLYINPNLATVMDVRAIAQKMRYQKSRKKARADYVDHWKRTFLAMEWFTLLPLDLFEFPERKIWEEEIKKRKPEYFVRAGGVVSPATRELEKRLETERRTIDLDGEPFEKFVEILRKSYRINVIVSKDVDQTAPVTIKVDDPIPIKKILELVVMQIQAGFYVEEGILYIVPQDKVKERLIFEIYRVDDILLEIRSFKPIFDPAGEKRIRIEPIEEEGATNVITPEQLLEIIRTFVDPQEWEKEETRSIEIIGGLLFVTALESTHKKLRRFIANLRALMGIMVHIEVRFLRVTDTFLEMVGIDFRHVDGYRVQGLLGLDDINTDWAIETPWPFPLLVPPTDIDVDGDGDADVPASGIAGVFGDKIQRVMGARVQHVLYQDTLLSGFYNKFFDPTGGTNIQVTVLDDVSVEALMKLVRKFERSHELLAQSMTLYNGQRGAFILANQLAYVRDWDVQQLLDPQIGIIQDGIVLDLRPRVSADRKFITMELRPTMVRLLPGPPEIEGALYRVEAYIITPGGMARRLYIVLIETPTIQVQRLRSIAVIPDRATILMGGFVDYYQISTESGVPILKDLPLIGFLAREKVKSKRRSNLLIFVKPRIIIPEEEEKRFE
jgi:tetratricopeptide (TPR) repeat protein/Flp pilus assembly secretin CpaC